MRLVYTLLLQAALPLLLLRLWWRGRKEPGYRADVLERLGRYDTQPLGKLIWIHAVSVGEARAAAPLVDAFARAYADHALLITCTTAAGRDTIKQVYGERVLAAFLPYDVPRAVQRFLEHFRPRLGILMETEVWPNLVAGCRENGVPLLLANARMSDKSARGYVRWGALSAPAFAGLSAVCAQAEPDAQRLRALGATKIQITGNLKFDVAPDPGQIALGRVWRERLDRPVLLLASTREGEEKLLLEALPDWDGRLLVLVVPRHPQRFDEVAQRAQSRRTRCELPAPGERVHLGDTMGEMAFYYAACDVAVIGGSFLPFGGQNLIEALATEAPVIMGPSMFNFAEAAGLALASGAAIQVADGASAIREAISLLEDPPRRARMAEAGKALCAAHRGATARHMAVCEKLLREKGC